MSVQHRSRIKSVVDYSVDLSDMGACCYAFADAPVYVSYQTCVENSGYFIPAPDGDIEGIECPKLGSTGCCCSCNYVDNFGDPGGFFDNPGPVDCPNGVATNCYQGGVKDGVTKCECINFGGVWAGPGVTCGVYVNVDTVGAQFLCTNALSEEDHRWPGACCVDGVCNNACSPKDCADIAGGSEAVEFYELDICHGEPVGTPLRYPAPCWSEGYAPPAEPAGAPNGGRRSRVDRRTGLTVITGKSTNEENRKRLSKIDTNKFKSCCAYIAPGGGVECETLSFKDCSINQGMWGGRDNAGGRYTCDSTRCQESKDLVKNSGKISSSYVDAWELGQDIFGVGRFAGVFWVKGSHHGDGSICYGNPETGIGQEYIASDEKNSINAISKFAIIVAPKDIPEMRCNDNNIIKAIKGSSSWDAMTNRSLINEFTLQNKISNLLDNDWLKWTVPPKDILAWLYRQVSELEFITNCTFLDNNPNNKFYSMSSQYYWSSTLYKDPLGGIPFAYIQNFNSSGKVSISGLNAMLLTRPICVIPII